MVSIWTLRGGDNRVLGMSRTKQVTGEDQDGLFGIRLLMFEFKLVGCSAPCFPRWRLTTMHYAVDSDFPAQQH